MEMYNPAHPGESILIIIEDLREETGKSLTIGEVAKNLDTTRKTLSAIINGRQRISAEMAIKLAKVFGSTPEVWLRQQEAYDIAQARLKLDLKKVKVLRKSNGKVSV